MPDYVVLSERAGVTGDVLTLSTDPNGPQPIHPTRTVVQLSVDGTVVIERGGSQPGGGSVPLTPVPLLPQAVPCAAKAWQNSNSAGGAAVSVTYAIPAGTPVPIDMSFLHLIGIGTDKNLSIRVNLGSAGTSRIALYFQEDRTA